MAVTEVERHSLVQGLIDTLGEERTEILMKCILPEGWDQLATKQDVELAGERLRAEFGEKFGELRGEFNEKFGELHGEFGEKFGELRGEFGELRGEVKELKGYIDSALAKQTRIYLLAMVGFVIMVWASALAPQFF
ncbi:MAG: hypothetical protein F4134_12885 [Acidimicrobiaceae bacterium]|nr:hypothetical protein [Acidimicrobiaceae bacterium]